VVKGGSSPITGPVVFGPDSEPVPPFAVTRGGQIIPAASYDKTQHQVYVGPHHYCRRCLLRPIPLPETICSFCQHPAPQEAPA
jgi:hypothetical protein